MSAQSTDPILTEEGMPKIKVPGKEYPLFFSVASVKAFSEKKGKTFAEMVTNGWNARELDLEDLKYLLLEALNGAEYRRQVFHPGEPAKIDDELVEEIFRIYHVGEIWDILLSAWSRAPQPAGGEDDEDPSRPASQSDGEASSD